MITENFDNYKTGGSHKEFNIEVVGTDTIIGNTNMLQESITLDEALCSDNNLKFGACEASQFSVQVANIFDDFVDKEVIVSVTMDGITTKYGTFKVNSDKPTADRVWRVLTCYDKMKDIINANVLEWYKGLTFPMPQKAYRDSFFAYLGIEQVEVSLINDDFMVQGGFTATDTLSGKTIITSICEFNGVFGHINRDGKFDYVSIDKASVNAPSDEVYPSDETYPSTVNSEFEADFECPPYENNSVTYEDYETDYITRVTMRGTASDVGTSVGVDGNEYIITNNPIIYGTEGSDELITALTRLLNKIGSISYRPYSVGKTIGNPCVEIGDAIIVNTRHQTINSYVIKRTLTGIQALRDKYSATGSKVYPQEVNSVREELSRTQGKMNMLTRTVDETKSQVIAIQTDLTDNYLNSIQTQTLISQSASQIQATVTQTIAAELPDLIDEATGGLGDRITVVESSYTQLSNEIVMKVKADGTVAQVALGTSAESGSNIRIKGDNIQLDGNVTITDGFRLTAGVIQSANYVKNTSGMQLSLSNGVWDSLYFKLSSAGAITATSGSIGGWTISSTNLSKSNSMTSGTAATQYQILLNSPATITNTSIGMYVRQRAYDGSAYGSWTNNFYVRYDGYMYANNVNIVGTVTANTLTVREGVINIYSGLTNKSTNFVRIEAGSEVAQTWLYDMSNVKRLCLGSVADGSRYSDAVTVEGHLQAARLSVYTHGGSWISQKNTNNAAIKINSYAVTDGSRYDSIVGGMSTDNSTWNIGVMNNTLYFGRFLTGQTSNNFAYSYAFPLDTTINVKSLATGSAKDSTKLPLTGGTITGDIVSKTKSTGFQVISTDSKYACKLQVGDGNVNRGIWDSALNKWMVYADASNVYLNGHASSDLALSGGTMKGAITYPQGTYFTWSNSRGRIVASSNDSQFYLCSAGTIIRNYNNSAYANIAANAFNAQSSYLIKRNIEDMAEVTAKKILNLNVVSFDYLAGYGSSGKQQGLIAEEVLKVIPSVVSVPDNYDEDKVRQQISNGEFANTLSLDYSKFVPYLIKMIQIQQSEIDNLNKSIA